MWPVLHDSPGGLRTSLALQGEEFGRKQQEQLSPTQRKLVCWYVCKAERKAAVVEAGARCTQVA